MTRGKRVILILSFIAILILSSGWFVFSKYIRPNHYQLLRPYTLFFGKRLVNTESRVSENDRLQILIPEGKAILGKESWQKEIELPAFWIDQIPVTIGEFKKFVNETGSLAPRYRDEYAVYYEDPKCEDLPVVFVSWDQAESYCEYYGGHLPTEAQWEKAARGPEGKVLYWQDEAKHFDMANYDGFYNGLTPAGWLPKGATVYGVLDMMGNVREWVLDPFIKEDQDIDLSDWQEIRSHKHVDLRILKGGSYTDDLSHIRLNWRDAHDPKSPGANRGFRCAYEQ